MIRSYPRSSAALDGVAVGEDGLEAGEDVSHRDFQARRPIPLSQSRPEEGALGREQRPSRTHRYAFRSRARAPQPGTHTPCEAPASFPHQGLRSSRDGLPAVYVQNMRFGSVYELRDFRMEGIEEIRYVHSMDATTRWGVGHTSGVIQVIWLTQSQP